jgi:hypothetical protein
VPGDSAGSAVAVPEAAAGYPLQCEGVQIDGGVHRNPYSWNAIRHTDAKFMVQVTLRTVRTAIHDADKSHAGDGGRRDAQKRLRMLVAAHVCGVRE